MSKLEQYQKVMANETKLRAKLKNLQYQSELSYNSLRSRMNKANEQLERLHNVKEHNVALLKQNEKLKGQMAGLRSQNKQLMRQVRDSVGQEEDLILREKEVENRRRLSVERMEEIDSKQGCYIKDIKSKNSQIKRLLSEKTELIEELKLYRSHELDSKIAQQQKKLLKLYQECSLSVSCLFCSKEFTSHAYIKHFTDDRYSCRAEPVHEEASTVPSSFSKNTAIESISLIDRRSPKPRMPEKMKFLISPND